MMNRSRKFDFPDQLRIQVKRTVQTVRKNKNIFVMEMERIISKIVDFIQGEKTCFFVYGLFVTFGVIAMLKKNKIPQWYIVILYFLGAKTIFNYNKCTLGYIECKLIRNVPKEKGLINSFVYGLLKISKYNYVYYFIIFYILFVTWYYFVWTRSKILL
jgi:hypothetical protein